MFRNITFLNYFFLIFSFTKTSDYIRAKFVKYQETFKTLQPS